jgi:uncharacterized protein YggE
MKKLALSTTLLLLVLAVFAQQAPDPFPKTIKVSGSAEMEIIPDEVFVNIEIREYQKKGEDKKDLETLKNSFSEACRSVGIADSMVSIVAYSGYNDYYTWKKNKKKTPDMMASVTYQVKFKSSKTMDELVAKLDDEATRGFQIVATNHSRMTEFRKQLKIQAIKTAKAKGIYLTEAIDEKLGEAIDIEEPNEGAASSSGNWSNGRVTPLRSQAITTYNSEESTGEIGFKKIKLRFEVNVEFALK